MICEDEIYPGYVRVLLEPAYNNLVTHAGTRYNSIELVRDMILRGKNACVHLSL
jgi:hypothetical protein